LPADRQCGSRSNRRTSQRIGDRPAHTPDRTGRRWIERESVLRSLRQNRRGTGGVRIGDDDIGGFDADKIEVEDSRGPIAQGDNGIGRRGNRCAGGAQRQEHTDKRSGKFAHRLSPRMPTLHSVGETEAKPL